MKVKVLHISHTDIRYDSRIQKEILSLAKLNFLDISSIGISNKNKYEKKIIKKITIFSLNLITKKVLHIKSFLYTLNFIELSLKIIKIGITIKPKIIHCHDTLVLLPAVFLKLLFNSRLIYDAHELESNKNMQSYILSKATYFIEKFSWSYIDVLVSVSNSINKWYIREFGFKKNILILNSPIYKKNDLLNKDRNDLRKIFDIKSENLLFVYVGDFCSGRGIDYILEAFSDKQIKSHVVFLGDGLFKNKILNFSEENHNIHFHPSVKHDEVVNLIKSSDVGICFIENVSLSDYYCLPNKLFEYLFAGLEILGSDMPEISEFINLNKIGKLCKLNIDDLKEKIKDYENIKPKKFKLNLDQFTWESQSEKLTNLYKEMVN